MTDSQLWHPFADMGSVGATAWCSPAEASGCGTDGGRYLDATAASGTPTSATGGTRSRTPSTPAAAPGRVQHLRRLRERAGARARGPSGALARVWQPGVPRSGGGDVIDTAAKLAARYPRNGAAAARAPDRPDHGYHGTHGIGTSLAGIARQRGRLRPARRRPVDACRTTTSRRSSARSERIGAGARRRVLLRARHRRRAASACLPRATSRRSRRVRSSGVLLVADCVICGFGRLGTWWGVDRWP